MRLLRKFQRAVEEKPDTRLSADEQEWIARALKEWQNRQMVTAMNSLLRKAERE
jgi:hypothetical protein